MKGLLQVVLVVALIAVFAFMAQSVVFLPGFLLALAVALFALMGLVARESA